MMMRLVEWLFYLNSKNRTWLESLMPKPDSDVDAEIDRAIAEARAALKGSQHDH